jgi:hypothetical protein
MSLAVKSNYFQFNQATIRKKGVGVKDERNFANLFLARKEKTVARQEKHFLLNYIVTQI